MTGALRRLTLKGSTMESIPYTVFGVSPLTVGVLAGLWVLVLFWRWISWFNEGPSYRKSRRAAHTAFSIVWLALGAPLLGATVISGVTVNETRAEAVSDVYGIEIDQAEMANLGWRSSAPTEPAAYGTAEVETFEDGELRVMTLKLMWTGEEYVLLHDVGGGRWVELPREASSARGVE